jgi:hypothetical protein
MYTFRESAITDQIESVLASLCSLQILIPRPAEVRGYLLRSPDLADLLPFIGGVAREGLGIETHLSLEWYHDPEIEDEYLTLYVRQEHYDGHIMDIIERVRSAYEEKLAERSGWLLVTTDFRRPRKS